ncbi:MAG TPA: hypothetical protein VH482_18705 [Thermomicrobiales bacterium]|jgi:hypothetical protein
MLTHDAETAEATLHVRMPADLRDQLAAYCAQHGETVDDVVTRAVWEELVVLSGEALPSRPIDSPIEPDRDYTVDEVIALCRDQWILMRVTGFDDRHRPERGFVLAHSFRRAEISRALAQEPPPAAAASDAPRPMYAIFRAFPRVQPGTEGDHAFADLIAEADRHLRVTVETPGAADSR